MSLRPRFASDGRLVLPASVDVLGRNSGRGNRGDIVGEASFLGYDPFERVASDLLLAEEFARANLSDRATARTWYEQYGVLDLQHFFPDDEFESRDYPVGDIGLPRCDERRPTAAGQRPLAPDVTGPAVGPPGGRQGVAAGVGALGIMGFRDGCSRSSTAPVNSSGSAGARTRRPTSSR